MTKRTLPKHSFSIKSFFHRFRKDQSYLTSLETAYAQKSLELKTLKRLLQQGSSHMPFQYFSVTASSKRNG